MNEKASEKRLPQGNAEREPRAAARCFGAMDRLCTFLHVFLRHTGSDLLSICEALRLLREERRSISSS